MGLKVNTARRTRETDPTRPDPADFVPAGKVSPMNGAHRARSRNAIGTLIGHTKTDWLLAPTGWNARKASR